MFVTEAGRGPAVLLIHGLGWSHALWHRVIAKLSGSYRVIAADTRGHASSAKPAGPYTMEQLTDDWAGILEACKVDRLAIVGVSQGGMIAMTLASREPDRVAALGLLGTASHFPEAAWARMQERGNVLREMGPRAAAEHTSRSVFSAKFALQHPAFLADFVENRLSASAPALGAATASLQGFDIRDRVSKVRCPVLIMHGTADGVIAHDSTAETSSVLPQAQTVLVEDAGHILPVESANLVETHLSRFLHANHCKPIGTAEAL
ncbi:alpha/beta hydrolase [Mesorhizobium sp. CO1-1-8]|nr:alpha/beta hydrolase [Mesorhizobium sp. CO1-1-8]